jgi:nitrite reductase/ring-hydroxylating ferredoxin subunit/uncharacterized membrane protein
VIKAILQGKILGHPLHPLLIHFPIGLFILALVLDVASFARDDGNAMARSAFVAIVAGIITALLAAGPGTVDWLDIRDDHPAKKTGTYHMLLNVAAVILYAISVALRWGTLEEANRTPVLAFIVSLIAAIVLTVSGYLGGHMVYNDGIAVGRHRRTSETPQTTVRVDPSGSADGLAPVGASDKLKEGDSLRVEVEGVVMMVTRVEGTCRAVQEFCTHRFGPLSQGAFDGRCVICPWHKSKFDVTTGQVVDGPAKEDLRTFEVMEGDGQIWAKAPPKQQQTGA